MTRADVLGLLQQHADTRGRVDLSVDRLQTLAGLDAHDVSKTLFELERQGLVKLQTKQIGRDQTRILSIRLRRGAVNEAVLSQRPARSESPGEATVPERAWAWLEQQPTTASGWVMATVAAISRALDIDPRADNRVGIAVSGWARQGRVALRKSKAGRIEAIKLGPNASPYAGKPAPPPQTDSEAPAALAAGEAIGAVDVPETPALDQYVAARRIANLAPADNPFIRVEFAPNEIAEEALVLKRALEVALRKESQS